MKRKMICLSGFCLVVLLQSFGSQSRLDSRDQANPAHQTSKWSKSTSSNSRTTAKLSRRMLGANPPTSQIGFLSAPQVPTGGSAYSTFPGVGGDFNGDGKPDVAMMVDTGTTTSNFEICAALSNGDGTFKTVLTQTTATEMDPIFVGDLNGDGKSDIVLVHVNGTIEGWISNGDGTFTSAGTSAVITSNPLLGGTLFDVSGDKKLDVVLADEASPNGNVWTLLGNGDGTFGTPSAVPFSGQLSPFSTVVFADFNGDGFLDFAGSSGSSGNLYQVEVYLNNGSNTGYQTPLALNTPSGHYESCFNLAGSLSGHAGQADIVVANCDNGIAGRASNLTVYVNNGDGSGTFANNNTGTVYAGGAWPSGLSIADINGDGKNDLVVTDQQAGGVAVLLGNGDGTLQGNPVLVSYAVGGGPRSALPPLVTDYNPALVADFNGDGHLDVMLPDFRSNFIYLQGYGDGSFRSPVNYYAALPATGSGFPTSVTIASGDFNGDGIPDFVIGNSNRTGFAGGITVFLSNADGSMQPGVTYTAAPTAQLQYVAVADLNGDGKLDIAATDGVNGGVQVFTGNGDGTFQAGLTFATELGGVYATLGIVAGDFNGDGHPDLAVVNQTNSGANGDVGILLNDAQGHGSFTLAPANPPLSVPTQDLTAADLNGDKKLDVIVPLFGTGNTSTTAGKAVAVLLGKGDGTFTAQPDFQLVNGSSTFYQPVDAAIGDLNGDGKPDLIVGTDDQVFASANQGIVVALGNGDGTFQTPNLYPSSFQGGPDPIGVQLIDLDGDRHLDVITANYKNGTVAVLYGKGDGTLFNPTEYVSNLEPFGIALADVNGDGAIDVITSGDGDGFSGVTVLLNSSADSTTANSSANPSVAGVPITLTATVSGSKVRGVTAAPTGTVTFFDGTTALGQPAPVNAGVAQLSVSSLSAGSHNITAQYNGDVNYLVSTSPVIVQVVKIAAVPDYSLTASPTSRSVNPGSPASYAITLTPSNGYDGTVTLACPPSAKLPSGVTCTLPGPVVPAGKAVTMTINTTGPSALLAVPAGSNPRPAGMNLWASLGSIGVFGLMLTSDWKKRKWRHLAIALGILAIVMILLLVGCGGSSSSGGGGGGNGGTPAGTYTVTVMATGTAGTNGGNTSGHPLALTLIVN
jgi:Bacterial Ig-like domain (group 3)/FG-GAP-like repeat/FG-GAP repeat